MGAWRGGSVAHRFLFFLFTPRATQPSQVVKAAPLPLQNDGAEQPDAIALAQDYADPLLPTKVEPLAGQAQSFKANLLPSLDDTTVNKLEAIGQPWFDPVIKAADQSIMAYKSRLHAGVALGSNDGSPLGAAIDASYSPMRGSVTCYTDDAGHVVALAFNTGSVCSPTANAEVMQLSDTEKVTGLAVAYAKTGKVRANGRRVVARACGVLAPPTTLSSLYQIGHLVFTVTTDVAGINENNIISKRQFKCGLGGGLPIETLPKGVALAGVDAACLARNGTQGGPSRRLSAVGRAASDIDPTSMRVIATKPESTGGLFVAGVVTPLPPRITAITWTANTS